MNLFRYSQCTRPTLTRAARCRMSDLGPLRFRGEGTAPRTGAFMTTRSLGVRRNTRKRARPSQIGARCHRLGRQPGLTQPASPSEPHHFSCANVALVGSWRTPGLTYWSDATGPESPPVTGLSAADKCHSDRQNRGSAQKGTSTATIVPRRPLHDPVLNASDPAAGATSAWRAWVPS